MDLCRYYYKHHNVVYVVTMWKVHSACVYIIIRSISSNISCFSLWRSKLYVFEAYYELCKPTLYTTVKLAVAVLGLGIKEFFTSVISVSSIIIITQDVVHVSHG